MNYKILNFLLMLLILTIVSCGKDKMANSSQSDSSSALAGSSNGGTCKMLNGGSLSGCCSSHGGAKNCTTGLYLFTSSNSLVCNDGTISPTCKGPN